MGAGPAPYRIGRPTRVRGGWRPNEEKSRDLPCRQVPHLERQPAVPAIGALEEACLESVGMQRADHKRQQPVRVQGIKQQPRAARAPSSAAATSPAAANRSATTTPHRRFTRPITARTPSDLADALDSRGSSLEYVAFSDDSPSHHFESCSPRLRARSVSASKWTRPQRAL